MVIVRQQVPPDPATSLTASVVGGNVDLDWTNPPDSTFQATYIVYRTDRFPIDPLDGILVADVPGSPSVAGTYLHTTAPLGATIYYAAFAHDAVRHFSPVVTATVNNGSPLSLRSIRDIQNGKAVNVAQAIVTAAYQNCFYVENDKRMSGIRVQSAQAVSVGNIVTINGILGLTGQERSLSALTVTVTGQKNPVLVPYYLNNFSVGGVDNGYVPGPGQIGANNVGLLVTTAGKKVNPDPGGAFFYLKDGSSANGLKVKLTEGKTSMSIPSGQYFSVTGASSLDADGNAVIWPRSQADIVFMR
jgi:hypothetical protein